MRTFAFIIATLLTIGWIGKMDAETTKPQFANCVSSDVSILSAPTCEDGHYLEITVMPTGYWVCASKQEAPVYIPGRSEYVEPKELMQRIAEFTEKAIQRGSSPPSFILFNNKKIWQHSVNIQLGGYEK
jgi:hypothetical protein